MPRPESDRARAAVLGGVQFRCGCDSVYRAAKLYQHAVAHSLDDVPGIGVHSRIENGCPPFLQSRERAHFVGLHQTAVADQIGHQDGG